MKSNALALLVALALLLTACAAAPPGTTAPPTTSALETTAPPPTGLDDPAVWQVTEKQIAAGNVKFHVDAGMNITDCTDTYVAIEVIPGQAMATIYVIDASDMDASTVAAATEMFKLKFSDLNNVHHEQTAAKLSVERRAVNFDYYEIKNGNGIDYYMVGSFTDTYYVYVVKYKCVEGNTSLSKCGEKFGQLLSNAAANWGEPRFKMTFNEQSKTTARATIINAAPIGEKNAANCALSYLTVSAFSYSGLMDQLDYEGYTAEEAAFAVNICGADWYEQAAIMAKSYLDLMPFSRSKLISQLEYEGFTHEQAVYGAEQNGY